MIHPRTTVLALLALAAMMAGSPAYAGHAAPQGFGAATPGGAGRPVVRVTNLNDAGPGSLRDAVAQGNRTVVFDVAGDIVLGSYLHVRGAFVTIDGTTAPGAGITLRGHGLSIEGRNGAHDVIVRGLRVRGSAQDGIHIAWGAYNVLVEHVSVQGSADGNLDITESARDVTVAWSILAAPATPEKNILIKYNPARVTLHHNLITQARQRNPQVRIDDAGTQATDTTLDMRNNVVWDWSGGYGTLVWHGPRVNVVANYYASPASPSGEQTRALEVDAATGGRAWVAENVSGDGLTAALDAEGTERTPFPAPAVVTTSACVAAAAVLADAGPRPQDELDARVVRAVRLDGCASAPPPPSPGPTRPDLTVGALSVPGTAAPGSPITITVTTRNGGPGAAPASTTRIYLSADGTVGSNDVLLATVAAPPLGAGMSATATTGATVPATTAPGAYRLLAQADAAGAVVEASETNNTTSAALSVPSSSTAVCARCDLIVGDDFSAARKITVGTPLTLTATVENRGTSPAPPTTLRFYLGRQRDVLAGAVPLGARAVPALGARAKSSGSQSLALPAGTAPGNYYVIAVADADGVAAEASESNNLRSRPFTIR